MPHWKMKLLYDGACPICSREIQWLKRRDPEGNLALEDISRPGFNPERFGLTTDEVAGALCGVLPNGRILRGIATVRRAYQIVGLGWLVAPTGWPLLNRVTESLYRAFARHRSRLGRLLGRSDPQRFCVIADGLPDDKRTTGTGRHCR